MIQIPENFPSYTSYSPKMLIQHVDQLKAICRELQVEIQKLKAAQNPVYGDGPVPKTTSNKKKDNDNA